MLATFDMALEWRGFELHPETPPGGRPLSDLFPPERLQGMDEYLNRFAQGFGVAPLKPASWLPNTRRALALAELAREHGALEPYRQAAMEAHWRRGLNLEDEQVLEDLALGAGLPAGSAEASKDARYLDRIDQTRQEAMAMGIQSIPTFVFGSLGVVGCHPFDTLAQAAREAGAQPKASPPAPTFPLGEIKGDN